MVFQVFKSEVGRACAGWGHTPGGVEIIAVIKRVFEFQERVLQEPILQRGAPDLPKIAVRIKAHIAHTYQHQPFSQGLIHPGDDIVGADLPGHGQGVGGVGAEEALGPEADGVDDVVAVPVISGKIIKKQAPGSSKGAKKLDDIIIAVCQGKPGDTALPASRQTSAP